MFNVKNNLALEIMSNIFYSETVPCNLRKGTTLHCRNANTSVWIRNYILGRSKNMGTFNP